MTKRPKRADPRIVPLLAIAALAIGALLYSVYGQRQRTSLRVGQPSPQTYVAPVDVEVVDRVATERERRAARAQIATLYSADPALQALVLNLLPGLGLPQDVTDLLVEAYRNPDGLSDEDVEALIADAVALAPASRRREVRLLLSARLLPTSVPNDRLTAAAREAAAQAVAPVMERLRAGQTIVGQGEPLTQEQLAELEAIGLYSARSQQLRQTTWIVLGCALLGALLALPLAFARWRLRAATTFPQLAFLAGLTVAALALQRLALLADAGFLIPTLVPLLAAVLIGEAAALFWSLWLALVTALLVTSAPVFALLAVLAAGTTAALLAARVRSRTALLAAGAAGGVAGALVLGAAALAIGGTTPVAVLQDGGLVLAGSVLGALLALGLLPIAETGFDFLTDFRLLELSSPSSPLLQKLLLEAPGSYQHSLIISNLVDQAVTAIGGNALLARVGALYHDVGKLRRPHFFVENQFSGENPHDALSPHLSFLIITSHVRDGVELLREHKVPRSLEPFVTEHHGTTVLAYFYKRALEDSAKLDELNFRYPGPKPRSKETAVLMLADAVESASRTLADPSQGSIRALIDRLIDQRLQDDQLSDSPLNFRDLEVIANTFERMLTAILHRRVSYPSDEEIRGLRRDRASGRDRTLSAP